MIFKRAVAKLRAQDWAAIAIELGIVVLGVFIGVQAANWNDAMADRSRGTSYLERTSTRSETHDSIDEHDFEDDEAITGHSQSGITEDYEGEEDISYTIGRDDDGNASILSDFASIFHPNEYITAQQRLERSRTSLGLF